MLITNGTVVTVDRERRIIKNGAVAIEGKRIAAIGKSHELEQMYPDTRRIDACGGIVMPGYVDCHVHLPQALIRGCADDVPLKAWLAERVWVLQGLFTPEDARCSAELCMVEMIKSGTTTFVDTLLAAQYGPDGIAEIVLKSGMRSMLAKSIMDTPRYADDSVTMASGMREDKETCFRAAREMYERWNGVEDRIFVWLGPRPIGGASIETYREAGNLMRELGTGATWHFAEGDEAERAHVIDAYGMTPTEFAEAVGLLSPRQVLGHCVWLDDADIANLARTGTNVCHLPTSNMKIGMGFARVPEMLKAGVNVCLGTDGAPSDNMHDMFHVMNLAALIHRGYRKDPAVIPAETIIEMATINGAKAVGLADEIGSLEVGKRADLILLQPDNPNLVPVINPISNLVYSTTGHDVGTVIIDGSLVMQDRKLLTLDEERILREAAERSENIVERSGIAEKLLPRWPIV